VELGKHKYAGAQPFTARAETRPGLKWNETHPHMAYADDMNLLGDNINTLKKITDFN
jgi:hypothetical protein